MENKALTTRSGNTSIGNVIIKDCPTNDLNTVLTYIYTLCGFEKMPDEKQDMVLIGFIREHFSTLSIEDMKNAFELGVSGETGVNMKHYHNFNAIYFADVINAYKTYKRSRKDLTLKLESSEITKQDKKTIHSKWLYQLIFPQIEKFNKGEITEVPDHGNTLYNYLDKKFINITPERKEEIKELAREELLKEFRIEKMTKPSERNEIGKVITDILMGGKETEGLVRTRAKNIALNIFLENWKVTKTDIIQEIKDYENL